MDKADAPDQIRKYGVTLTPQIVSEIDAAAKRDTTSRSNIIRQACWQYLRERTERQEARDERR